MVIHACRRFRKRELQNYLSKSILKLFGMEDDRFNRFQQPCVSKIAEVSIMGVSKKGPKSNKQHAIFLHFPRDLDVFGNMS